MKDFLLVSFFWAYWFYFGRRTGETRPVLGWFCRKTWVLSPWRFDEFWRRVLLAALSPSSQWHGSERIWQQEADRTSCVPFAACRGLLLDLCPCFIPRDAAMQQHVWKSIQGWVTLIRVSTSLDIIQGRKALECSRFPSSCLVYACNGLHPFFGYCPL